MEDYEIARVFLEPFSISFGVLGLITMVCMLVLNMKRNQPLFIDFHKIGMRRKHILQVALWYTFFLVAGIFLFSIWGMWYVYMILSEVEELEKLLLSHSTIVSEEKLFSMYMYLSYLLKKA